MFFKKKTSYGSLMMPIAEGQRVHISASPGSLKVTLRPGYYLIYSSSNPDGIEAFEVAYSRIFEVLEGDGVWIRCISKEQYELTGARQKTLNALSKELGLAVPNVFSQLEDFLIKKEVTASGGDKVTKT